MATNLAIEDHLIEEARVIGRHRTKKAAVTEALQEYIQRRKQIDILKLFNAIEYEKDYNYKELCR
ncbi:MAG: type II toxin-antitoxin system VapB family antitoxin [Desulfobacterales bacterium]|nr:type II toxin-antitoxin system VapB family antitoxin [Desulfobacterales bacterium]